MNAQSKTAPVKLFANFEKNIFILMEGEQGKPDALHSKLKAMGAAIGRHSITALIEGKEALVRGFEIINAEKHLAPALQRSSLPAGTTSKTGYHAVGEQLPVRKGSKIAIGMELLARPEGVTEAELTKALGHDSGDSVHSFLMYRPKKRGYGIKMEGDKYHLVFPDGVTDIKYK